jgi:hypothetical protein
VYVVVWMGRRSPDLSPIVGFSAVRDIQEDDAPLPQSYESRVFVLEAYWLHKRVHGRGFSSLLLEPAFRLPFENGCVSYS